MVQGFGLRSYVGRSGGIAGGPPTLNRIDSSSCCRRAFQSLAEGSHTKGNDML